MAIETEKFAFTIEVERKTYHCERVVSGTREYTQLIRVIGIGTEPDGARYGPKRHRPESMEPIAQQIARELVIEHHVEKSRHTGSADT